jgi:hypothetical protein
VSALAQDDAYPGERWARRHADGHSTGAAAHWPFALSVRRLVRSVPNLRELRHIGIGGGYRVWA